MNEGESTLALPHHYGKYELLERIGTGGMAEVYRARLGGIAGFEKAVVIKRLHPQHARDQEFVQLFVEEAKLAAEVQHKNVVSVFDLGSLETGEVFMAMEYIAGTDLKDILRHANQTGRRVPPWLSVHVAVEVLEALAYAHGLADAHGRPRNIVHCDVTPENVFLSRSGEVKLGDFGVANDDARARQPFEGHIRGKVPYMSPEQVQGDRPDRRTDVFSLGIVLWECLTQRRLFSAPDHAEIVRKVLFAPRIPPSHLSPDVPAALDAVVLDALSVDPDRRPSDARAMQMRLLDLLEDLRPRHTLTDVREGLSGLFPGDPEPTPVEEEIIDLDGDAILGDVEIEATLERMDSEARDAARAGLFAPSALRDEAQTEAEPETDAVTASAPDPIPPPARFQPGSVAHAAWLALGGDPARPPPRMPPPRFTPQEYAPPRMPPPRRPPPRTPPTRDIRAPIPSPPSGVETKDILRSSPDREPVPAVPQDLLLPGAPVPAEPPPRVKSSATRHPLWVRAPQDVLLGPLGPAEALDTMRSLLDENPAHEVAVTADRRRWLPADRLEPLLGEAPVDPSWAPGPHEAASELSQHSMTALCGHLARTRQSGRLIVIRETPRGPVRWDLSLRHGALVSIGSSRDPFEVWTRALDAGSGAHGLKACLHQVFAREAPLSAVATGDDLEAIRPHRVTVLQNQLQEIFSVDEGKVWLQTSAPTPAPLGPAIELLRLLPAVVSRARRTKDLRIALGRLNDVALVRASRFESETAALELPRDDRERLKPFGNGHTLAQSLGACRSARDEKLGLVLAYLLVEMELLTPYYYSHERSR